MKFIIYIFLCLSFEAGAQTACPVGVAPGSVQCLPDSESSSQPSGPIGEWIKAWGAIASSSNGDVGSSTGKFSEQEAKDNALKICTNLGNSDCKVMFTYKNQCVAVVKAEAGRTGGKIVSGASVEDAKKKALNQCKNSSGAECSVVGADCSKPFFKKY
ncbi:DUF4189 domain-containing protein [Xanthomonas sp. CFBP 8703]|uniref:DUF4189 domain-containing protein n=1 Tax=Xanthomonas bonasiae TaxID=2810351 RepID=A0ABS3AY60_9XANT|nr:DUF4189 domain-containing protein [Xanthomonas bonasiae]MBN6101107.1 DUF4189 domain-containing protein [Xanthomonas bonasiae]